MTPPPSEKKKKRTLVIIDGDALREGVKYDLSFLENEKRLEIWFFYKDKIHHSFRLRRDFSAHNVVMPRYEEDLLLYILKRVCYELGRREGRYRKVLLIGTHHRVWEGLVQFLRERDLNCTHILADDYRIDTEAERLLPAAKAASATEEASVLVSEKQKAFSPSGGKSLSDEEFSALFKRKGRVKPDHLTIYRKVLDSILSLAAGTQMTRKEFRKMLESMSINVDRDLPGKNLDYFLKRLIEWNFIAIKDKKIIVQSPQ
ncbi:MAG: hypothetical protein RMK19_04985 [Bacteroidia bacterium]|nr:hypothetical protein [Bacteroidia bacterium]MDW8015347.1 hypothetical protein [Bacteroidia bacterium]